MTGIYVDIRGRQPYIGNDTTRNWVESIGRKEGLIRPQLVLRVATDSNHIMNEKNRTLYDSPHAQDHAQSQSILNNCLPGQKIPGVLNWSVTESLNQTTQQATFDCLNCLPLSNITTTISNVNTSGVAGEGIDNQLYYSNTILGTWAQDSLFSVERVTGPGGRDSNGNKNISFVQDAFGYWFREENVKYRLFKGQTFTVVDASKFPDPAIPDDDDNDVKYDNSWSQHTNGAGSYFILVDQEVMRVCELDTNTFHVPPGGRGINGIIQTHSVGSKVTLLGHGEPTGEYCGLGYLAIDDFHPEKAILRPGTCLVSYEGYGDIIGPLYHDFDPNRNYTFTGYWFVDSVEPSLGADGVPRVAVTVKSAGNMYDAQKIDIDTIQRMKNQFGQWTINGRTLFSAAGADRRIPGDWVDYNSWDPTDQYSYPLQIMTEYAQNYAFFSHMLDTQNGLTCEICRQELADYVKTHKTDTDNPRDRPVGRHVYKESIRVLREHGGPIKTYIRLMATFAAASWDHPAYGTELSQKFSKIPNQLFDNIRNIFTGKCYNGQLDYTLKSNDLPFDYEAPDYDDRIIISRRKPLTCAFQSSYDNAPFSQPMIDLAQINGATFWVDREGYPCFKPYGWNMRSETSGYRHLTSGSQPDKSGPRFVESPSKKPGYNGEWWVSYGSSIESYSANTAKDQIVTQMWVTCNGPLDVDNQSNSFTVTAGGSGYNERGEMIFYSPLSGHKIGLMMTGGVQQTDTMSMDNQYLGLDWNTNPASWGLVENLDGVFVTLNAKPAIYDGFITVSTSTPAGSVDSGKIQQIKQFVNFMLVRGYINPIVQGGVTYFQLTIDGNYTQQVADGMEQIHSVFASQGFGSISGGNYHYGGHTNGIGEYGRASGRAASAYLDTNAYYIKTDIWWYVYTERTWDEYVAAIIGLPVPFTKGNAPKPQGSITSKQDLQTTQYVIDDKGLQQAYVTLFKTFAESAANVGNRAVNQTIDQAVTRSIQCSLADPRVIPGDTAFCEIPGHLSATNDFGETKPPFNNGIYVTDITRSLDLESGTYTATYSGTRAQGLFGAGLAEAINPKEDFITS